MWISARPARNIAEVVLRLDNADRAAPAPYNDGDEIEVARRIERGSGSNYRINGVDLRARDIQRLFADLATGSSATALVGQGEIGSVVNVKPEQRRLLLEEAAGITGLHSRRHEAELRLRATEANLERLDDVMQNMDLQLRNLKQQARQATRYRNLSEHILKAQALLLHQRWTVAEEDWTEARRQLTKADARVNELTREAARASVTENGKAETLTHLRESETDCAARIRQLTSAQEWLDKEEHQTLALAEQLQTHVQQIENDAAHEAEHARDSSTRLESLSQEQEEIEALQAAWKDAIALAEERAETAWRTLSQRERELLIETQRLATESACRERLEDERVDLEGRFEQAETRLEALEDERCDLEVEGDGAHDASEVELNDLRSAAAEARCTADDTEVARAAVRNKEASAREALQEAEAGLVRSRAEAAALENLLSVNEDDLWPPLIDSVAVEPGYEAALGAALGDDLALSGDAGAPAHWYNMPPLSNPPTLPAGAEPLARKIRSPDVLGRRLSQIGVVADQTAGDRLREDLRWGQRLVTRDGALWRWDGYTVRSGASTTATTRLGQRNQLRALRDEIEIRTTAVEAARTGFAAARNAEMAAAEADAEAHACLWRTLEELRTCEERRAVSTEARARRELRLAAISEATAALEADHRAVRERVDNISVELAVLADPGAESDALEALSTNVAVLRAEANDADSERRRIADEAADRTRRLRAITKEQAGWRQRLESATPQLAHLAAREAEAREGLAKAEARPQALAEQRAELLEKAFAAKAERREAADGLARAQTELVALSRASKEVQNSLAKAQLERVRAEGLVIQAEQRKSDISRNTEETMNCIPTEVASIAGISGDKDLPPPEAVKEHLKRLEREREKLGPVNLRVDVEAADLSELLSAKQNERGDVEAAIGRLRQGISSINRDARDRTLAAFEAVDGHFRELFKRLFGGGEARLSLVDSGDGLEAGLEILASPPGKRPRVMSLLSGGEQALTAVALLFAVFLTRPAPVCVLDEVDAPLDDANVERFFDLIREIAGSTDTRFLIITHHPISMARMDRLFGVTMVERGVSQLVSVDLARAKDLRAIG